MDMPVTPGYNLKKRYLPSPAVKNDHSLDQYIDFLKSKGIQVHQSIKPAMFSLSNGLLYPGLKTQEQLSGPHLLVKVPRQLLLTTCTANIPELQKMFEDDFYSNKHFNWEDRIICTFLLYIYATKPEDSVWLHMVNNLSRQIDILTFWPEEDIKFLNDRKVDTTCKKVKQQFQRQWLGFTQVIQKYSGVIPEEVITKENYLWLYTHLVSRSFGKFLKHVTMVPFCELFNHHNSDVLYDFLYNESNPLKSTQTKYESPQTFATESARAQIQSSDGSYDSQDQMEDNEYDYSHLDIQKIKWGGKISFNLKQDQTVEMETKYNQLMNWLHAELYWKDFSIILIAQVLERMNIAKNQYMAGRKKFPETMAALTSLKETCQAFKMKSVEYYKILKGHKFQYRHLTVPPEQSEQESIPQNVKFMQDKFDFFTMRMNKRDHFEANNQVYFCYGRLSNRMMLCRYGMALEGNKYDHAWISMKIIPHIEGYPDTIQQMQEMHMSTRQKFKIKRRQMSLQLVMFIRMTKWDLQRSDVNSIFRVMNYEREIQVLEECIKLIEDEWQNMGHSKELEEKLLDKSISYHEYFGTVYQLEHCRIFELHLKIFRELLCIVQLIKDGMKTDEAVKPKTGNHEELQLYHYLKPYFNQLVYVK